MVFWRLYRINDFLNSNSGGYNIKKIFSLLIVLTLALFCISAVSASEIDENETILTNNVEISSQSNEIYQVSNDDSIIGDGEITISDSQYPDSDRITRGTGSVTLNVRPYVLSSDSDILYLNINGYSQAVAYISVAKSNGVTFTFTEAGTYTVYAHSTSIFGQVTSNTLTYIIGGGSTPIDTNKTYQTSLKLYDNSTSSSVIYKNIGDNGVILNNLSSSELGNSISDLISKTNKEGQSSINEFLSIYMNGEYLGQIAVSPNGQWANGATLAFTEPGWYNFTAFYKGNEHLSNAASNVLAYYVAEADENTTQNTSITIDADPLNLKLGESALITPSVYDSNNNEITSGYINIYVDNSKVATINVGQTYTITPSDVGTVEVYAEFLADASHKSSRSNSVQINVTKDDVGPVESMDTVTTINVNATKVLYGNKVLITPKVTDKNNKPVTSGRVAISVLDMNMTTINVGESYEYYPFLPSTYDIKAYYLGNDEYNPSSSSTITITVVFEDDGPIDNTTDDNSTGDNATDDNTTDTNTTDNTTDDNVTDSVLATVSDVSVNLPEIVSGDNIIITPKVTDKDGASVSEGNVEIYINDILITTTQAAKSYNFILTETGDYTVQVKYLGSEKYNSSVSKKVPFKVIEKIVNDTNVTPVDPVNDTNVTPVDPVNDTNVTPVDPVNDTNVTPSNDTELTDIILSADELEMYYHDGSRFVVRLTDEKLNPISGETININLNGRDYTRKTDENGLASMAINLDSGIYDVDVSYAGSDKYNALNVSSKINVKTTIVSKNITKIFRNGTQYVALILDFNGTPVSGVNASFNINGVFYNRTTDLSGYARLNINLRQGEYIITAFNPVTGEVKGNTVTVLPTITDNENVVKYYRNATPYKARLWGYDGKPVGAGVNATFNINGVFYTRTTDSDGWVKLNINLEPGDYIITAEYNDCQVSNNVTVLSTIVSEDLEMNYLDGSKFNVTVLDNQGNPNPNQSVSFNINGVLYDRTTDANGLASLNINLQKGEYIITTTYGTLNKSNKITIA